MSIAFKTFQVNYIWTVAVGAINNSSYHMIYYQGRQMIYISNAADSIHFFINDSS